MRICYYGTYDRDYCRNQILQRGIELAGGSVVECHGTVWQTNDKSQLSGLREKLATGLRLLRVRRELQRRYPTVPEHDAIVVGYLGHLDMVGARKVSAGKPVVLDAFLSLYETAVEDRGMMSPSGLEARFLKKTERAAYERADLILLDTNAHIDYVASLFDIPREKFARILVGADDRVFTPPTGPDTRGDIREVLFYGKFIPLHGIETIIRAAHILSGEPDLRFTLVGTGQTYETARTLESELGVTNIRWIDWVDYDDLPASIAASDVCLGVFGGGGKAARVIPNKVFQALACGATVITADCPAMREMPDMEDRLVLVPPADHEALAEAIRSALRERKPFVRPAGVDEFMPETLGRELLAKIETLL